MQILSSRGQLNGGRVAWPEGKWADLDNALLLTRENPTHATLVEADPEHFTCRNAFES